MAYENINAAYDLSLFDEDTSYVNGSAVPKRKDDDLHKKQKVKRSKAANKVVTLPEDEINRIRRRRHNPLKLILGGLSGAAVAFVIGLIIVGQVQLTELNQEIISAKSLLADTQSIYTQNQMKVEATLSNAEIEEYAENVLGMTKASNAQKEFVTLSGGDKAEVSAEQSDNIFVRFIDSIKNLWS